MGITLCTDPKIEKQTYAARVSNAKGPLLAARGIGSHNVPVPPTVLSKIYWSVSVSKMVYGLDVKPVSDAGLEELEKAHRNHAKLIQGLPQNVPNPAPLATLGWMSMTSYIAIMKLCFLLKILCFPDGMIYKRVCVYIINSSFIMDRIQVPNSVP